MRLEDQGKEVKTAFLRGTRMWKIKTRILGGVTASIVLFYAAIFYYVDRHDINLKKVEEAKKASEEIQKKVVSEKVKYYEKRLANLKGDGKMT